VIGTFDLIEQPMMIDPHNADEHEAYDEREIRRPLPRQLCE
jgi:hypothetical protein